MSFLQLDVGNSGIKWRVVDDGAVLARGRIEPDEVATAEPLAIDAPAVDRIWVASVGTEQEDAALAARLQAQFGVAARFPVTPAQGGGLKNSYAEPWRMGIDRWLAMLAARARWQGRLCVVDAGSALTIDLVSDTGEHEGGYIIPGLAMMRRSLLSGTQRVRFEESVSAAVTPGRSTGEAVEHGSLLALTAAITRAMDCAEDSDIAPRLFITGGDAPRLAAALSETHQLVEDLVFEGLSLMADE